MLSDETPTPDRQRWERIRPDVLLTSAYTASYPAAARMTRAAKEALPSLVTDIGGVNAHFMYEEVLTCDGDALDFVARGEGEKTLPELMSCLQAGDDPSKVAGPAFLRGGTVVATPARPFVHDLDSLRPAWDLVDWSIYEFYPMPDTNLAIVSSSRGCDQACSFCSQQVFWRRSWRARTAEAVVDELEMLRDTHGVGVVMLSDETPTLDRQRWERILDLLIQREIGMSILMETRLDDVLRDEDLLPRYREAGNHHIYVGVERTEQATLDMFKKNTSVQPGKRAIVLIDENDMISETSLVLGLPSDTHEGIESTFELACHYDPHLDETKVRMVGEELWDIFAHRAPVHQDDWQELEREYWEALISKLRLPATVDEMLMRTDRFIQPIEGMISLLERLHNNWHSDGSSF